MDEAHSSQSGEAATELKGVLAGEWIKEEARQQVYEQIRDGLAGQTENGAA